MEAASLATSPGPSGVLSRRTPLLRFQSDERLVALMREGHERAFELLFKRYQARLLAFCRRLLGSPEDAEDVLQEVFLAAHAAILADSRPINARPWLYRIARNQCVNHLRKPTADGTDSMDALPYEHGVTTLEQVQEREELRAIVGDVHQLPETQRTALVLRELDDLSYTDIAQTMGTTLPSVKSLLVRARMSLTQSSHARGALVPFGLLALLRRLLPAKLKLGGSSGAGGTAGVAGVAGSAGGTAGAAGGVAAAGGSGATLGGVVSAASTGIGGALGAKAAVGVATAAIVAAAAVGAEKMDLVGHGPTAGSGGSATATSQATSPSGSSATSPAARASLAADTAPGSKLRAHPGHGRGAKAGKSSPGHVRHLGRSAVHAGNSHATRVAAAGASAAGAVTSTTHAASNAAAASVKPPKSVGSPAPGLGHVADPPHAQPPGLSRPRPLPPKLRPPETVIP
jgi:RNA polymerase sigma factor (sigma-70 family)